MIRKEKLKRELLELIDLRVAELKKDIRLKIERQ